jgi:probable HAF family extracellular repeat protein
VLWQNTKVTDLGSLGGTDGNLPSSINNRGEIVGESQLAGGVHHHAFLWHDGVISDLGTLPGDVDSSASHINDNGQIAGYSFDVNGNARAVLWSNGRMWDLNILVPPNSGILLQEALDINNRGQIAGFGCGKCDGSDLLPFLATPTGKFVSVSAGFTLRTTSGRVTRRPRNARSAWERFFYRNRYGP